MLPHTPKTAFVSLLELIEAFQKHLWLILYCNRVLMLVVTTVSYMYGVDMGNILEFGVILASKTFF